MKAQIRGMVPKWVRRSIRSAEVGVRETLGLVDSDDKLVRDSHEYWNATGDGEHRYVSHWRGGGDFADDERWLSIGRDHLAMFERFARGDTSRSRASGSTGLGLAIVKAVVDAHGGEVTVTSRPGNTVFRVALPGAILPVREEVPAGAH